MGKCPSTRTPITSRQPDRRTGLKADLRNLAQKVRQGKTLSASERHLLQSTLSGGKPSSAAFVQNQVELSEILGVDRTTIQRHRKIDGNPGVRPTAITTSRRGAFGSPNAPALKTPTL